MIRFCEQRKESHQHRGTILSGVGQNRVAAKEGYFPRGEKREASEIFKNKIVLGISNYCIPVALPMV